MADASRMRASDADREHTVAHLRQAAVDGRLDPDELEQRLEVAYRARMEGELVALVADLPPIRDCDVATRTSARPIVPGTLRRFAPYVIVNLSFVSLWAATAGAREPALGLVEGPDLFWPIFSIVGWGGVIGASAWRRRHASQVTATEMPPRVLT